MAWVWVGIAWPPVIKSYRQGSQGQTRASPTGLLVTTVSRCPATAYEFGNAFAFVVMVIFWTKKKLTSLYSWRLSMESKIAKVGNP